MRIRNVQKEKCVHSQKYKIKKMKMVFLEVIVKNNLLLSMTAIICFTILIEFKQFFFFFALFYWLFLLYDSLRNLITYLELSSVSHYGCVLWSQFRVKRGSCATRGSELDGDLTVAMSSLWTSQGIWWFICKIRGLGWISLASSTIFWRKNRISIPLCCQKTNLAFTFCQGP